MLTGVSRNLRLEELQTCSLFNKSIQNTNKNLNAMETTRLNLVLIEHKVGMFRLLSVIRRRMSVEQLSR